MSIGGEKHACVEIEALVEAIYGLLAHLAPHLGHLVIS